MFVLFYLVPWLLLIPLGIYFYFYVKRILNALHINTKHSYVQIIIALLAILFVYPAHNVFSIWLVVVGHMFVIALLCDAMIALYKHFKQPRTSIMKLYQMGIIPILVTVLIMGYGYWNMHQVHQQNYTITTTKQLSKDYRVAFLSDLHFPQTMNEQELQKYCEDIEKQSVDMVILGGDIVDEQSSYQNMQTAFKRLGQIKSTYGTYYVYGNHDRASYVKQPPFSLQQLTQTLEINNIQILSEKTFEFNHEFALVGREDSSQNRQTTQDLIKNLSAQDFLLLVDHKPIAVKENNQAQIDLQLSGHTHGGQMFPIGLMIDFLGFGELSYGYEQYDHLQIIVSSGIGGWGYSLRTGSQSEYLIIDIHSQ